MIRSLVLSSSLVLLAGCGHSTPEATVPSVLITTVAPRQGSMPIQVVAYGSAQPARSGMQTLSINEPGQILRVLVTVDAPVRAGQPVLLFAVAPAARIAYQQAVTQLRAANEQRDTTARLLSQQLATRDQLVQANKAVADAQATLAALDKEGASSTLQTLRAPFDGIVTSIAVAPGDRLQAGTALATVARRGSIVVTVGIPIEHAAAVHAGQTATIEPLAGTGEVVGRVLRVAATLDPQTRLVNTDVSYPAGAIPSGLGVTVAISTATRSGWLVPHDSVVTADGPTHIFQVRDGKAQSVPVDLIQPSVKADLVSGPIDASLPVIVTGAYQVSQGDAVRTAP